MLLLLSLVAFITFVFSGTCCYPHCLKFLLYCLKSWLLLSSSQVAIVTLTVFNCYCIVLNSCCYFHLWWLLLLTLSLMAFVSLIVPCTYCYSHCNFVNIYFGLTFVIFSSTIQKIRRALVLPCLGHKIFGKVALFT